MPTDSKILLTGFEPYGGMTSNPSAEAIKQLDGDKIGGRLIACRILPVALDRIEAALAQAIGETRPAALLMLGLAPGEAVIRIERVALNLADFALPDNAGATMVGQPLLAHGPAARWATLPLAAIEAALMASGTPARLSETAGTYLCNASLYLALSLVERQGHDVPCGFIHVPMTPELAAHAIRSGSASAFDRVPPASMELSRTVAAVRIALESTVALLDRTEPRNPARSSVA